MFTNGIGDAAGTGFETVWRGLIDRFFKRHIGDHVPAPLPGRCCLEHFGFAVDSADSGGGENFVTGEDEEIAVESLHIDLQM
jgi:hypothetical protein